MTTKEKLKEIVTGTWGFPLIEETERSLVFKFQMNIVQVSGQDNDIPSVTATLSGIFSADNDREMEMGLKACNHVNYNLLQVKAYIDSDNDLILSAEYFCKTDSDLEDLLHLALRSIVTGKRRFIDKYKEIEAEYELMSELNEPE